MEEKWMLMEIIFTLSLLPLAFSLLAYGGIFFIFVHQCSVMERR